MRYAGKARDVCYQCWRPYVPYDKTTALKYVEFYPIVVNGHLWADLCELCWEPRPDSEWWTKRDGKRPSPPLS